MPIWWRRRVILPSAVCMPELARQLPERLEREGWRVVRLQRQFRSGAISTVVDCSVTDGGHRAGLMGLAHREKVLLFVRPLRTGWRLSGYFGRAEFCAKIVAALMGAGAEAAPRPDPDKLAYLRAKGITLRCDCPSGKR